MPLPSTPQHQSFSTPSSQPSTSSSTIDISPSPPPPSLRSTSHHHDRSSSLSFASTIPHSINDAHNHHHHRRPTIPLLRPLLTLHNIHDTLVTLPHRIAVPLGRVLLRAKRLLTPTASPLTLLATTVAAAPVAVYAAGRETVFGRWRRDRVGGGAQAFAGHPLVDGTIMFWGYCGIEQCIAACFDCCGCCCDGSEGNWCGCCGCGCGGEGVAILE